MTRKSTLHQKHSEGRVLPPPSDWYSGAPRTRACFGEAVSYYLAPNATPSEARWSLMYSQSLQCRGEIVLPALWSYIPNPLPAALAVLAFNCFSREALFPETPLIRGREDSLPSEDFYDSPDAEEHRSMMRSPSRKPPTLTSHKGDPGHHPAAGVEARMRESCLFPLQTFPNANTLMLAGQPRQRV